MKRHEIINTLIKRHGYTSYLEIGLDEGNHHNDEKVMCAKKLSVDPAEGSRATHNMTSDAFFAQNKETFDIIFIDGLHETEQVLRDIENSLKALNKGGTIVCHDCNPTTEEMQRVPRMQGEWTGDVWKAFCYFRGFKNLSMYVVDTDYGVGIIQEGHQAPIVFTNQCTYDDFNKNKKAMLNLISIDEFKKRNPVMSVCIPTFEQYGVGVKNLTVLLNSLMHQKNISFEVIVSDNSQDDGIEKLCATYTSFNLNCNLKYIRNRKKIGISNNTNNAIEHASCNRIKIMYMDDVLLQDNALYLFSEALNNSHWVVSRTKSIDANNKAFASHEPTWHDDILFGKNTMGMPSIMAFRKNEFRFDPKLKTRLDCEFMWLMWNKYDAPTLLKDYLVGQRYHNNSTSRKQGNLTDSEYEYLKQKHGLA